MQQAHHSTFDFDRWSELASRDPEGFEARRTQAIEAAIRQPWDRMLGEKDAFVGMDDFGASAPAGNLFPHFGITADAVVTAAKKRVA